MYFVFDSNIDWTDRYALQGLVADFRRRDHFAID